MPRALRAELVLDARAELGEGARWDERISSLLWVDILRGELHKFDPSSGRDIVRAVGRHIGAVAPRKRGGYIAAVREGFVLLLDDRTEERLASPYASRPELRFNDGRADRVGRFWADSLAYDHSPGQASLFRVDTSGSARPMVEGLSLGNGLDWSPDGRLFYLVDTPTQRVDSFDFQPAEGELSGRRPFLHVPEVQGHPDGLTVDAEGCLWLALFGGGCVHRYTPDGRLDARVDIPGVSQVTSCAFGGRELDVLYITTARENMRAAALAREPHA
jgi:sugar lactone lactonase YvrE